MEAAEDGDPDALLIFDNFARMLGVAIAGYVNVFEPDRLTIGGGLSRASHLFLDRADPGGGRRAPCRPCCGAPTSRWPRAAPTRA